VDHHQALMFDQMALMFDQLVLMVHQHRSHKKYLVEKIIWIYN